MSQTPKLLKHYQRIASLWPADPMRPQGAFTKAIAWRENNTKALSPEQAQAELRNVNALYSLLDNRYQKKYPLSPKILAPQSNPNHYNDLIAELEVAPNRSWFENFMASFKGKIRMS